MLIFIEYTVLKSGSKAIIVGDNNQFAAVGMAGAFKKICTVAKVSTLTEVMRHKHQDDWTMSLLLPTNIRVS
ncbi:AAA family ATPase [Candidatus Tisiphia endosymbiont of Ditula angustiorana]|uniref:AAA family ATPase n=1 Tax=Candidatus Tisiphia endosymbiont of Ditula angustiorana TaxID=3066272 RepID=UPI00312CA666